MGIPHSQTQRQESGAQTQPDGGWLAPNDGFRIRYVTSTQLEGILLQKQHDASGGVLRYFSTVPRSGVHATLGE